MELFTHPCCFSRNRGLSLIRDVLKNFEDVSFREVNIYQDSKRASRLGVKMSPTLVLDGKIISVGLPEASELKAILSKSEKETSHA
ncbi:MAG: thioredoxin family protein [Candidatus Omnitrophica bacterium]|nr:thioredoxin family protein [Candidatus Omnitrophota bacterium]